jgi:hypothetical protein
LGHVAFKKAAVQCRRRVSLTRFCDVGVLCKRHPFVWGCDHLGGHFILKSEREANAKDESNCFCAGTLINQTEIT